MKAWSKTLGIQALSGGESELPTVVRATTEGLGNCCDWDGPSTRMKKKKSLDKIRVSKTSGLENRVDAQTMCPWSRPAAASPRKHVTGYLLVEWLPAMAPSDVKQLT